MAPTGTVYGNTIEAFVLCPTCGLACPVDPWIRGRRQGGDPLLKARVGTSHEIPIHVPRPYPVPKEHT